MKDALISHRLILLAFLLLLFVCPSYTSNTISIVENYQAQFITFKTKDGLTNNHILDIAQDHSNFLWIATLNGLNKYDGQTIKNYVNDPLDQKTIPPGIVYCVDVDESGIVWVGTQHGLCYYDAYNDSFQKIDATFDNQQINCVRAILNEGDSLLWIEDDKGFLLKYHKKKKEIVKFWEHTAVWQVYYYYHDIYRDKKNRIWFGGRNLYPYYLDEKEDKIVRLDIGSVKGKKQVNDISCYFEDSYGNFWISGLDGAYIFNSETNYFDRIFDISTFSIIQTRNKNIWLATKDGIYQYDFENARVQHYKADINGSITLPNNHVNKLFEDNQGNVWAATDNGLALYKASNEYIKVFNHIPGNDKTIASNYITASILDRNDNIWLGHQDNGIDILSKHSGLLSHYNKTNGLPSNRIKCFFEDSAGDMYVGLWEGIGFTRKKKNSNHFELFRYDYQDTYKDWYKDFSEDKLGNFYLGFWGGWGLSVFDRTTASFSHTLQNKLNRAFESRLVTKLLYDSKGRLWVGTTRSGLHIYYPEVDTSECFFDQAYLNTSFTEHHIHDIYETLDGSIWIAADSLLRYNPEDKNFKVWGNEKGLTSSNIYKILEDDQKNLWLGTQKGILCFNPKWDYCISFPDLDGIEMNHDISTATKLFDGRLLFGGLTGMIIFDPVKVLKNQKLPDIILTELRVKGEIKYSNLSLFDKLELDYHENFFTVGFSNTDLTSISKYSYRYRLNNLEENWTYIKSGNFLARYTNLKPGNYVLEIQLALNNSSWSDIKVKTIQINIKAPFWETFWFTVIVVIVLLLAFVVTIRFLYRRILTKRKMSELKELLLRAQINPHFIFNALGAIQGYIYKKEEKEAGKYLAEFSRLIRLTLENTKKEYIPLKKEIELLEYYLSLQKQRFKTKFTYSIDIDEQIDIEQTLIPPMLGQPFVENAIEHGVTKKETSGHVSIKMQLRDEYVLYVIEDNGIGRKKSMELKKGKQSHKSYGTEITEERLHLLKRKYRFEVDYQIEDLYENQIASGTRVIFKIPANLNKYYD